MPAQSHITTWNVLHGQGSVIIIPRRLDAKHSWHDVQLFTVRPGASSPEPSAWNQQPIKLSISFEHFCFIAQGTDKYSLYKRHITPLSQQDIFCPAAIFQLLYNPHDCPLFQWSNSWHAVSGRMARMARSTHHNPTTKWPCQDAVVD